MSKENNGARVTLAILNTELEYMKKKQQDLHDDIKEIKTMNKNYNVEFEKIRNVHISQEKTNSLLWKAIFTLASTFFVILTIFISLK